MVAINPFNYEQITIIFIFLSVLLGILLFVRKNKDKLNVRLHNEKSIFVLEDTSISPSERLRLIKVGNETFLMSSGKGVSAKLIKLDPENSLSKPTNTGEIETLSLENFAKPNLNDRKTKKYKAINPKVESKRAVKTDSKSIFDAIRQARVKNPLLGFDK